MTLCASARLPSCRPVLVTHRVATVLPNAELLQEPGGCSLPLPSFRQMFRIIS